MQADLELCYTSATELAGHLRAGQVSAVEVVRNTLARIAETNPLLNAFTHVDAEGALAAARDCDAYIVRSRRFDESLPPLCGIPVSVKELIEVRGLPCRYGSRSMADHVAADDAPSVARLRAAGAIIIGMTNTSEFGYRGYTDNLLHGVTRNPWNPTCTPGGSSGGAASAVAAGMTALALGTDGGGSIRNPSGFCGLVGIKPQFGRVPVYPASATVTLAHVGPMTRTVADASLLLRVIAGADLRDWTSLQPDLDATPGLAQSTPMRIAYSPTLGYGKIDAAVRDIAAAAIARLEGVAGPIEMVESVCGDESELFMAEFVGGCSARLGAHVDEHPEDIDPPLLALIRAFRERGAASYTALLRRRLLLREHLRRFFDDWDVLLTPMTPCPSWKIGQRAPDGYESYRLWTFFGYPFNLTGQPAATLPCGFTAEGLPIGLQLVVRPQREKLLIDLLTRFEAVLACGKRRPSLPADGQGLLAQVPA